MWTRKPGGDGIESRQSSTAFQPGDGYALRVHGSRPPVLLKKEIGMAGFLFLASVGLVCRQLKYWLLKYAACPRPVCRLTSCGIATVE
jgi:hypothetical protein